MKFFYLPVLLLPILAACGGNEPRYALPDVPTNARINVSARTIEVRDAQLPLYATEEEFHIQQVDGSLSTNSDSLWADDPTRAVTQALVRTLIRVTDAQVAAEPWPLVEPSDKILEVRFDKIAAESRGVFHMSGQYYVSDYVNRSDRAKPFVIEVPTNPANPASVAQSQSIALAQLAEQIARADL